MAEEVSTLLDLTGLEPGAAPLLISPGSLDCSCRASLHLNGNSSYCVGMPHQLMHMQAATARWFNITLQAPFQLWSITRRCCQCMAQRRSHSSYCQPAVRLWEAALMTAWVLPGILRWP